ncbi:venom peptide isomerase heavy chain-like [Anoplophora glabripennis]|uniref:venom peptide isomerase heavy chain-like n=1 Tax=Anoplophora glabripennis TaxID=217634 RepID=UPI0008756DC0|nr:venom peptide isomerase heavy chain-like [Anoplophora glabripennis]
MWHLNKYCFQFYVLPLHIMTVKYIFVIILCFSEKTVHSSECGVLKNANNPPWNIGIYKGIKNNNLEIVCLGTAIKSNLIVTAAHCLCDQSGKLRNEEFYVSSKKLDKNIKDNRNLQKVEKNNVFLHRAFKGDVKHGDIAVVKLQMNLKNDESIPICIDWENTTPLLHDGEKFRHSSWQNGNLKMIDVSYVDYENCPNLASTSFRKFLTSDKLCAKSVKGLTAGDLDEGSGLVYFNFNDSLWYIRGVVCGHDPERTDLITYSDAVLYLNWLSDISSRL